MSPLGNYEGDDPRPSRVGFLRTLGLYLTTFALIFALALSIAFYVRSLR